MDGDIVNRAFHKLTVLVVKENVCGVEWGDGCQGWFVAAGRLVVGLSKSRLCRCEDGGRGGILVDVHLYG